MWLSFFCFSAKPLVRSSAKAELPETAPRWNQEREDTHRGFEEETGHRKAQKTHNFRRGTRQIVALIVALQKWLVANPAQTPKTRYGMCGPLGRFVLRCKPVMMGIERKSRNHSARAFACACAPTPHTLSLP